VRRTIKKLLGKFDLAIVRESQMPFYFKEKYSAEIRFWKRTFLEYIEWYDGKKDKLYGEPSPSDQDRIVSFRKEYSAIKTWENVHQRVKYQEDLKLTEKAFEGMNILDIGSGPHPSALGFLNCNIYCLDPLLPLYMLAGFPQHIYEPRVRFVSGFSENMPFEDNFFDAIISVNALDHVDDFQLTANEIKRVLKPNGKLRFHLHYHQKTIAEPLELNDIIVQNAFTWCKNFRKIYESKRKRGSEVNDPNELYTLWSNF
jgi:ubiquinone/menaquinone biosynthesis C-methylase UbiE